MEDEIFISVKGQIRKATEEEAKNIREAQANAIENRAADTPNA
jgi:hypothetical protein